MIFRRRFPKGNAVWFHPPIVPRRQGIPKRSAAPASTSWAGWAAAVLFSASRRIFFYGSTGVAPSRNRVFFQKESLA
jgi:hypothetical protein